MELLTDDVKEKLIDLIENDLQFVDKPRALLCSYCGAIPLFHYIYPCSHPYCRDCYVNVCVRLKKKCRVCKSEIGNEMLQSKDLEVNIYKIKAVCPNKLYGCNDEIELSLILDHLVGCKFAKEKQLPKLFEGTWDEGTADLNDLKLSIENLKITVNQLVTFIQTANTREEQQEIEIRRLSKENRKLTTDLQKLISDVPILMGTNETMDRKLAEIKEQTEQNEIDLKEQVSAFKKDFESIKQQMQQISDTVTTAESNTEKKEQQLQDIVKKLTEDDKQLDSKHDMLTKQMDTYSTWVKATRNNWLKTINFSDLSQEEFQAITENIEQWKNGTLLWQITGFTYKKHAKSFVRSNTFYLNNCGYQLTFNFLVGDYMLSRVPDKTTPPIFHYRATVSILDQSNEIEKRDWTQVLEPPFGKSTEQWVCTGRELNFANFDLKKKNSQSLYLKDNTVYIKVVVEPLSKLFRNYFSRNGILVSGIDNYARAKRESLQKINNYRSDYFYSGDSGYRMQVRLLWLRKAVFFVLVFLVGENDAWLPSFYPHKLTVKIVNQNDESGKNDLLMETETFDVKAIEEYKKQLKASQCTFICSSQSNYEKYPFLFNDKIVFKVVVKIL